ncbi:tail fiber domain-containing protein [bacterium]|nr:tail fiber domain-containing protein [bacterium]
MKKYSVRSACLGIGKKGAFSLMEMMIVLLIISIVAAATAPVVTKKMARSTSGASPWSYIGMAGSIVFNPQGSNNVSANIGTRSVQGNHPRLYLDGSIPLGLGNGNTQRGTFSIDDNGNLALATGQNFMYNTGGDNRTMIIGSNTRPGTNPKLYVRSAGNEPQIALGDSNNNVVNIVADMANGRTGISNATIPNNTTALGTNQTIAAAAQRSVAIGDNVRANAVRTVAIGSRFTNNANVNFDCTAQQADSVAIGSGARALISDSTVVGSRATGYKSETTAIGFGAEAGDPDANSGTRGNNATAIGRGARATGTSSTAVGATAKVSNVDQSTFATADRSTALGASASAAAVNSVAIGYNARIVGSNNTNSIAIGSDAGIDTNSFSGATTKANIAIGGRGAWIARNVNGGTAIGNDVRVNTISTTTQNFGSTAIGSNAHANHSNSFVIGTNSGNVQAASTAANQIVLGTAQNTVYIPGNLVVGRSAVVNLERGTTFTCRDDGVSGQAGCFMQFQHGGDEEVHQLGLNGWLSSTTALKTIIDNYKAYNDYVGGYNNGISDRRLKNVGEKFTGGLEQIKKLDLYNFTFKKDTEKTPQVGIMAQDLQKVFPTAVWKGEDGYLRIRWDEMFYAVINAVKELDSKIATAFEQIKANTDKVAKLQAQVDEQKQVIKDLQAKNAEFEKRLAKLEKKAK